jgi:hypothetical protein
MKKIYLLSQVVVRRHLGQNRPFSCLPRKVPSNSSNKVPSNSGGTLSPIPFGPRRGGRTGCRAAPPGGSSARAGVRTFWPGRGTQRRVGIRYCYSLKSTGRSPHVLQFLQGSPNSARHPGNGSWPYRSRLGASRIGGIVGAGQMKATA